jgi:hypothetical protein
MNDKIGMLAESIAKSQTAIDANLYEIFWEFIDNYSWSKVLVEAAKNSESFRVEFYDEQENYIKISPYVAFMSVSGFKLNGKQKIKPKAEMWTEEEMHRFAAAVSKTLLAATMEVESPDADDGSAKDYF